MTCGHGLCRTDWTCSIDLRNRWNCLRRGLRLKDGPGSARAATVSAWLRWGCILSQSARTGLADSRGQARYPEGGRRREDEPRRECAFAPIPEDDEHQDGGHLEN